MHKKSGAHSHPGKKPVNLANGTWFRLTPALQNQRHLVVNPKYKVVQEPHSGHIPSIIRKNYFII